MWNYKQPTEIRFGLGERRSLPEIVARFGRKPVMVTDSAVRGLPMTAEVLDLLGTNAAVFSDVEPNPSVGCVDRLAAMINDHSADVVVALGGGSSLDCAKAACSVAVQGGPVSRYHSGGEALDGRHIPLIAMPTTAGTGSEVTPISVLDDPGKGLKAPMAHDNFFPSVAIVDPEFTFTMPKTVTAATGFDALAHAIEGYWSKNHQPICDLMALETVQLFFRHFPRVLRDGTDAEARAGMSQAALLGGLAFQLPKNAAVHACSYPLSSRYHLAHGVACAMTLDHFVRFNAEAVGDRGIRLAEAAGGRDMHSLAEMIADLKKQSGLPTALTEVGIPESDLDSLVDGSFHPIMKNNPGEVTPEALKQLYISIL